MDALRLRPSTLATARPRDHFQPAFCSTQQNGQGRVCFSSQRIQGPTLCHHQKFFDWKSSYYSISHRSLNTSINAPGQQLQSEPEAHDSASIWRTISSSLNAFYRFSRPHTVIGTALSIVSVSLLAVESMADISPLFLTGLLEAVVAALFMNIYIVGLNQLFDIEIDKVNKPTLPLASGEYSPAAGVAIVSVFAAMSFGLGWVVGSQPLFWALFISFVLGTAYSINVRAHVSMPTCALNNWTFIKSIRHFSVINSCKAYIMGFVKVFCGAILAAMSFYLFIASFRMSFVRTHFYFTKMSRRVSFTILNNSLTQASLPASTIEE